MPSETHKDLYRQLRHITTGIQNSLEQRNPEVLPDLLHEQECVMKKLHLAGPSKDSSLLGLVMEIRDQVASTMIELEKQKEDIARQLRVSGNKKKLVRAYGV